MIVDANALQGSLQAIEHTEENYLKFKKMKIFMIVLFGTSVIRQAIRFVNEKDKKGIAFIITIMYVVAYAILLEHFLTFK